MIKPCKFDLECVTAEAVMVTGAHLAVGGGGNWYEHKLCGACGGYKTIGPSTDYESLDRREKQIAYELWAAAQPYESKSERRLRRNHMKTKWILRHSQIRAAAKARGPRQGFKAVA